jgi:S1-C subfamily serine protease
VDSYDDPRGAFLNVITPGGSASIAGLFTGNVIQPADGQPVRSAGAFVGILVKHHAGDSLNLSVMHFGKPEPISLVLQPANP